MTYEEEPKCQTLVWNKDWPDWMKERWPGPSVEITHRGYKVTVGFEREDDVRGEGPIGRIEISPYTEDLEPRHVREMADRIDVYVAYAQSALRYIDRGGSFDPEHSEEHLQGVRGAADALRAIAGPGRGHDNEFYRRIAQHYDAIVEGGERHPIKALSQSHHVTISTASRWVKGARDRGYIDQKEKA